MAVGSAGNRGELVIGAGRNATASATLACDGGFSAYLNDLYVAVGAANCGSCAGTLDLSNATFSAFDVSTVTIGDNSGGGSANSKGLVDLGVGSVSFSNLTIGAGTATGSVLRLKGTRLTVGNSDTNQFSVALRNKIILDLDHWETDLAVYGDYRVSGPATSVPVYLANGRIVVVNGPPDVWFDGQYTRVGREKGAVIMVR